MNEELELEKQRMSELRMKLMLNPDFVEYLILESKIEELNDKILDLLTQ